MRVQVGSVVVGAWDLLRSWVAELRVTGASARDQIPVALADAIEATLDSVGGGKPADVSHLRSIQAWLGSMGSDDHGPHAKAMRALLKKAESYVMSERIDASGIAKEDAIRQLLETFASTERAKAGDREEDLGMVEKLQKRAARAYRDAIRALVAGRVTSAQRADLKLLVAVYLGSTRTKFSVVYARAIEDGLREVDQVSPDVDAGSWRSVLELPSMTDSPIDSFIFLRKFAARGRVLCEALDAYDGVGELSKVARAELVRIAAAFDGEYGVGDHGVASLLQAIDARGR